jgi:uncharacterized protein YjiS (DUF1127 family)
MSGLVGTLARLLAFWFARARSRRELAKLDARMLDDIGVTREQADAQARKLPWQD